MFLRLFFLLPSVRAIQALWDEGVALNKFTIGKGCGCKAQKCDGLTTCCKNYYKMCTPCIVKCKCKT